MRHNPGCSLRISQPQLPSFCIDISEAAIAAHKRLKDERNLHNLEVSRLDLRELAGQGRTFDPIFSTGVLHHLGRPEKVLGRLLQRSIAPERWS